MGEGAQKPPLGQLVLHRGLLTEGQLEVALAEHMSTGKRLGEVLVDRGWLTAGQIDELLLEEGGRDAARGIDLLRASVAEAEAELEGAEPEPEADHSGHVLFVWSPSGYELLIRAGKPPPVGGEVGVTGGLRVVTKIGRSPLPGDPRACAFLDAP